MMMKKFNRDLLAFETVANLDVCYPQKGKCRTCPLDNGC